jgi:hypothetical protein
VTRSHRQAGARGRHRKPSRASRALPAAGAATAGLTLSFSMAAFAPAAQAAVPGALVAAYPAALTNSYPAALTNSRPAVLLADLLDGPSPAGTSIAPASSAGGYHFDYPLPGTAGLSPQQAWSEAQGQLSDLFPFTGLTDSLTPGAVATLGGRGAPVPPSPVKVVAVGDNGFELVSLPGHPEGAGRLISFTIQQGQGGLVLDVSAGGPVSWFTLPTVPAVNTPFAHWVWGIFAASLDQALASGQTFSGGGGDSGGGGATGGFSARGSGQAQGPGGSATVHRAVPQARVAPSPSSRPAQHSPVPVATPPARPGLPTSPGQAQIPAQQPATQNPAQDQLAPSAIPQQPTGTGSDQPAAGQGQPTANQPATGPESTGQDQTTAQQPQTDTDQPATTQDTDQPATPQDTVQPATPSTDQPATPQDAIQPTTPETDQPAAPQDTVQPAQQPDTSADQGQAAPAQQPAATSSQSPSSDDVDPIGQQQDMLNDDYNPLEGPLPGSSQFFPDSTGDGLPDNSAAPDDSGLADAGAAAADPDGLGDSSVAAAGDASGFGDAGGFGGGGGPFLEESDG